MKSLLLSLGLLLGQFALATPQPENYPLVDGVVKKVSVETQKVTIRHGDIPNLDMPGMTMVFTVADPELLNNLNVGDEIQFAADKLNGVYTLIWWQKAAP